MKKRILKSLMLIFLFLFINKAKAQWILNDTVKTLGHFGYAKFSTLGEVCICGIPNSIDDSIVFNYYLREDRTDLVYFTQTGKDKIIRVAGFYKLSVQNECKSQKQSESNELITCWRKDLVWYYFDKDGNLSNTEFYNNGELVKPKPYTK